MSKRGGVAAASQLLKNLKNARDLEKNIVCKILAEREVEIEASEDIGDEEMEIQVDGNTYKSIKDEEELGNLLTEASIKMAEMGMQSSTIESFLRGAGDVLVGSTIGDVGSYLWTVASDVKDGKFEDVLTTAKDKHLGGFEIEETKLRTDIQNIVDSINTELKLLSPSSMSRVGKGGQGRQVGKDDHTGEGEGSDDCENGGEGEGSGGDFDFE